MSVCVCERILLDGLLPDSPDALPASRITDIVGASTLTDEEIQWLIGLLLEKSKANSEWEAVSVLQCVCVRYEHAQCVASYAPHPPTPTHHYSILSKLS